MKRLLLALACSIGVGMAFSANAGNSGGGGGGCSAGCGFSYWKCMQGAKTDAKKQACAASWAKCTKSCNHK
ncbi:hypothetical protein [Undibacterium baiyunense]|uniref:Uncharacterized protein n=1 Tax=Undibacterium baiyunense TaxID=2828731 RepID=A0A941I4L3_9BURK|nr:hypothetical protein [Undibacterium baiyunense]MBR7747079.1 hypothetical protein [Undibacterium baiyunense]